MKKSICYLCSLLIAITAVIFLVGDGDLPWFFYRILPCIAISVMMPQCKEKHHFNIALFFSVWVVGYDVICLILLMLKVVDLREAPYQLAFRFIIPLMYAIFQKALYDFGRRM